MYKIFCIGQNKTGTTSLTRALSILGYRLCPEDGMYQITPIGRLVNVKILANVPSSDYENLKEELKQHYKNDFRVRDVYICGGGTVMIDCRN